VLGSRAVVEYELEFYEDENGDQPVQRWLREELTPTRRRALGHAMNEVLQRLGIAVCRTEFGRQLGGGLFEFRLRRDLREMAPVGAVTTGQVGPPFHRNHRAPGAQPDGCNERVSAGHSFRLEPRSRA